MPADGTALPLTCKGTSAHPRVAALSV